MCPAQPPSLLAGLDPGMQQQTDGISAPSLLPASAHTETPHEPKRPIGNGPSNHTAVAAAAAAAAKVSDADDGRASAASLPTPSAGFKVSFVTCFLLRVWCMSWCAAGLEV